jgi:bla regulator protein BlaR1
MTSAALAPPRWAPAPTLAKQDFMLGSDAILQTAWAVMSLTMLIALAICAAYVYWRKRSWTQRTIAGVSVDVSLDVGPAVVGLLRPRIVVPAWLLDAPAAQQALVIAHEQAHLDARDPQLLTLTLLLLSAMPWNVSLWWQLHRLRHAIEVDCDARVLAKGHDRRQYGTTLLDIGQRQSAFIGTVAAMAESRSLLEQRIRIMVHAPKRWARRSAPLFAALALCMVAVAAQVAPPAAPHRAVTLSPKLLPAYEGYYQLNDSQVMIVSQSGNHLVGKVNVGRSFELVPESDSSFFVPGADAQVSFVRSAAGQPASAAVLRQMGVDLKARRVGADVVQRIDEARADRIARQAAAPGGEQILRRNLELARNGKLRMDDFSPEFGRIAQRALPQMRKEIDGLGKVESIAFDGVGRLGDDKYLVRHEHGGGTWYLSMNASGKLIGATYQNTP